MHDHFFHWHNHAELKPEPSILDARWKAAASATKSLSSDDLCFAICLALFPATINPFAPRLSTALVKLEPTFPPKNNGELLRVMATAGIYQRMAESSVAADAISLGIKVGVNAAGAQLITPELVARADEYLSAEAERVRGNPPPRNDLEALEEATAKADWETEEGALNKVTAAIFELRDTMDQMVEENQFLWWLNSRRSPAFNERRSEIKPKEYALVAAQELAERVKLLPPPLAVEYILAEVLTQCSKGADTPTSTTEMVTCASARLGTIKAIVAPADKLCPITNLVWLAKNGNPLGDQALTSLGIETKMSPITLAKKYLNELMFFKALEAL